MKYKIKKYVYLINDVTNLLLKKEKQHLEENARKLRLALIFISAVLAVSLLANIYFIFLK